jgi:hypothetical protein
MIDIFKFLCEKPNTAADLLPEGFAQEAINCKLESGKLKPFRAMKKILALENTGFVNTLHAWTENRNKHVIDSQNILHFAKSPISDDTYEREYFTGEDEPRFLANDNVSYPFDFSTDYLKTGIPVPENDLTVGAGTGAAYRAYVYSYVNSYGDEGPPSDFTSISTLNEGVDTIAVSGIASSPPASRAIDRIFLYRTNSSDSGTAEFQFVLEAYWFDAEESYAIGDFVIYGGAIYKCTVAKSPGAWIPSRFTAGDDVLNANLLSIFPKTNYDAPPDDLTGLVSLPNGTQAGISGKSVYFSEPFHPHAWSTEYRIGFDETPVALAVTGRSVIVLTNKTPYMLFGDHPSAMAKEKIAVNYRCLSALGVAVGRDAVFWPTDEGLAGYDSTSGFSIKTEGFIDDDTWALFHPERMIGAFFRGKYFGFDPIGEQGFIIDFASGLYVRLSIFAHACLVDGKLYLACDDVSDGGSTTPLCMNEWEGHPFDYLQYQWTSRIYTTRSTNPSAAKIRVYEDFYDEVDDVEALVTENEALIAAGLTGELGLDDIGALDVAGDGMSEIGDYSFEKTLTFKLYANGTLRKTKTITEGDLLIFRLPGTYLAEKFYINLTGYIPIDSVSVKESVDELFG